MIAALIAAGLCGSAHGAWLSGGSAALDESRRLFEASRYQDVIASLGDTALQRLRAREQRRAYHYLGLSYERLGHIDKALGVYQLSVKLFPKDINLLTELASLLHSNGLEEQAEPLFQKVLSIHPNNAAAHLGLAQIDHSLGFLDRSADHYDKALETMADNPAVWSEYAEVLLDQRNYTNAELAARRALSLKLYPRASLDLARAQRGAGRLADALDTLAQAISRHPAQSDLASALALWQLEAGHMDKALAGAEALIARPDASPLAYWIRARARLHRNDYNLAVDDLHHAASAERLSPFVAAAARELLKQLGSP